MIEILVNGQARKVAMDESIEHLIAQYAGGGPIAVALNGQFVGKENYAKTTVVANDKIDILSPIQGG